MLSGIRGMKDQEHEGEHGMTDYKNNAEINHKVICYLLINLKTKLTIAKEIRCHIS